MRVIDLTAPIEDGMAVYPGDPKVRIDLIHTYQTHEWELRKLQFGSHTGTHVDAFSHMDKTGKTIDQIPLDCFFGPAQLVAKRAAWPKRIGLLFSELIDIDQLDALLAASPPFIGGDITEELERVLLKNEIITYTGLVNLDQIPLYQTFHFYGLPLKITDGDGSPVRAIAILNE